MRKGSRNFFIYTFLVLCSVLLYAAITWINIGLTPDGFTYFEMARSIYYNIQNGHFFLQGISHHFPPLYPILLSILLSTGLSSFQSAKLLGGLMFVINACFIYSITFKRTKSILIAIIVTITILLILVLIFASALTEPLFYLLLMVFLLLVSSNLELSWKVFFVLMLTSLLRYAGVSLFFTYVLIVVLKYKKTDRLKGIVLGLLSQIPVIIYTLNGSGFGERYISLKLHNLSHFMIQFILIPFNLYISFDNIAYLIPGFYSRLFKLLGIFIVIAGIYWPLSRYLASSIVTQKEILIKRCSQTPACVFIFVYTVFILLSRLFVDGYIPANLRIFSPVLIASVFLIPPEMIKLNLKRFAHIVYLTCVFSLGITTVYKLHNYGKGYTSVEWNNSPTIGLLRKQGLEDTCTVYSNLPEVIKLYLQKDSKMLPKHFMPSMGVANSHIQQEIDSINNETGCKVVVFFNGIRYRWFVIDPIYIRSHFRIEKEWKTGDGYVFKLK